MSKWECPICHKMTDEYPALSRKDNKTHICTRCGQTEALTEALKCYFAGSK